MAERRMEVGVLELHRARQYDIRVIRGIGLEVVEDDGEKIVSFETLPNLALVRIARHRIGGVDKKTLHGRVVEFQEALAQLRHVQRTRLRWKKVGPPYCVPVTPEQASRII